MGGWIGQAFAQYYPERLISLTIGGWAPVDEREQNLQNTRNETGFIKMLEINAADSLRTFESNNLI